MSGPKKLSWIFGSEKNDCLVAAGSLVGSVVAAGNGNDTVIGSDQGDVIFGGNGRDLLFGGRGADAIHGGNGPDTVYGGGGNDWISGTGEGGEGGEGKGAPGKGKEGNGPDLLYGDGYDSAADMRAGKLSDFGHDVIFGSTGADTIYGDSGKNTANGGNDRLFGGAGNDRLYGEGGDDRLSGGAGSDTLSGGAGKDKFVFHLWDKETGSKTTGVDCITDFKSGEDKIDLSTLLGCRDLVWGGKTPTANGVWYATVGGVTYVYADVDGKPNTPELTIKLTGAHQLTAADFIGVVGTGGSGQNQNVAPTAENASAAGDEDSVIPITLGGSDSDGVVTGVVLASLPANGTLYSDAALSAVASLGTTYAGAAVTFYFRPAANFNGTVSFQFTVVDDSGESDASPATATIGVNAVNDAPTSTADVAAVDEDGTLNGASVLGNDADVDGNTLTAVLVSGPAHGSLTLNANGTFTYLPASNFNGNDSFVYRAVDPSGAMSAPTAVTITVNAVNDRPTAGNDGAVVGEDGNLSGASVLANDADVEAGALTAVLVSGPAHGALTLNANGTYTYVPAANFNGTDGFTYRAVDGGGAASDPATVSVTVTSINDAPTFALAGDIVVAEDAGPQTVTGFATGVGAGAANEAGQVLTFTLTTDNDALFAVPPTIDPATGTLSYVLAPNANGYANIQVRLADDGGIAQGGVDASVGAFRIVAAAQNDGPLNLLPAAPVVGDEDSVIAIQNLQVFDIDVDDAPGELQVTLSVAHGALSMATIAGLAFTAGDGTADASMTFTGSQAAVNAALATLSYRGNADFNGTDVLTIITNDQGFTGAGGALSDTDTITITVNAVNDAPVATANAATVDEDGVLAGGSVLGNDSDVDGDNLTAMLVSDPLHGELTLEADGTYSYAPESDFNGTDSFTYRAADGAGGFSDPATVTITVNPVNDGPVTGDDRWFLTQSTTVLLPMAALLGNDGDVDGDVLTVTGLSLDGGTFVTDASDGAVDGVIHLGTLAVDTVAGTIACTASAAPGVTSFFYQVSDGALSDRGHVLIQTLASGSTGTSIDLAALDADDQSYAYIDGKAGNDTLVGSAGADVLLGGADIDVIRVGTFGNDSVDGGSNGLVNDIGSTRRLDILAFDGTLDLTTLAQNRIVDIETMSMTDSLGGAGADSLKLNAQDVIDLGRGTFDPFGSTYDVADAIRVDGDVGDTLTLAGGGWLSSTATNVPSGYKLYVHDTSGVGTAEDAHVLAQSVITVVMG